MQHDQLPEISDEQMNERLAAARDYSLVILKTTPTTSYGAPIVWEHGRRNLALRTSGVLAIVCPVTDGSDVAGICLFDASPADTEEIMREDPAIVAGVLVHEVHPVRGFGGDSLPTTAWTGRS